MEMWLFSASSLFKKCIGFPSHPTGLLPCASENNMHYSYGSDANSNAYFPHEYPHTRRHTRRHKTASLRLYTINNLSATHMRWQDVYWWGQISEGRGNKWTAAVSGGEMEITGRRVGGGQSLEWEDYTGRLARMMERWRKCKRKCDGRKGEED